MRTLLEVFDSPYPWKWLHKPYSAPTGASAGGTATFTSATGVRYKVKFKDLIGGLVDVTFEDEDGLLSSDSQGDPVGVLTTVMDIISVYLRDVSPEELFFSGDKEDGRSSVYRRILNRKKREWSALGYTLKIEDRPRYTRFKLSRPD